MTDFDRLEVIAPNFKRRLSGVTSTIIALVPAQRAAGLEIATFGPGLPDDLPKLRYRDLWRLWRRPTGTPFRIWHARRNSEMAAGIAMRTILRMPLKLVFTSAAQREHKAPTRWMLACMDDVVATSDKSAAFLHVPHTIIMHGVDTDRFRPPADKAQAKRALGLDPKRFCVGCSGRIRRSKGTDLFVDAMIALLHDRPDWEAVMTGRTTAEHAAFRRGLENRIARAGLSERIRFVGEVADIVPWYQAFDLFIAPSRVEGFGLTPLEAMACGVPVVATDAGAYRQMIDEGATGYVARDMSAAALADAVANGGHLSADWNEMANRARATVIERFSIAREVDELGRVYDAVLRR